MDVIQKCISANEVKNNVVIAGCNKLGTIYTKRYGINHNQNITEIENKYTDRWDEPDPVLN